MGKRGEAGATPYRQDTLALWRATLGLLLCTAPPRRAPQVTGAYAQATLAAEAYAHVVAAIARMPAWTGARRRDPARQVVVTPRGGTLTIGSAPVLAPGEVLLYREGGPPCTRAVATRAAEPSSRGGSPAEAGRRGACVILPPVRVLPSWYTTYSGRCG
jgi:hypothetical protein